MRDDDLLNRRAHDRLRPVAPRERIPTLDVDRGFAPFGVLLAYSLWNPGGPPEEAYGPTDRIRGSMLSILVDTKA
jgi:uncharacterized membrane protein YeiB